jgi:NAD(P)-dependent dehydrogenase (short-subunit alcohol dehydrogenase family)
LAAHNPRCIYLCARRTSSGDEVVSSIHEKHPDATIEVLELDLNSFDSIKNCGARLDKQSDRLDILFLNAGVAATAPSLTKEGYESQFGSASTIS